MISLRNLLVVLVVWTVANPVWLANGSIALVPATPARHHTRVGGVTHLSSQSQFQEKSPPASSPSSLGASPLGKLSVDLFFTMFLLHPLPSGLAATSGWFRDSVDKSLDRGNILRPTPPATGVDPYEQMQELVKKQTKSLGKYRLTTVQIMSLLYLAEVRLSGRSRYSQDKGYCAVYACVVVKDLLHHPKFAETMNGVYAWFEGALPLNPVREYLNGRQPDLALEMIRVAGLNIGKEEMVGAIRSFDIDVLAKLCKFAEAHPQKVTFVKPSIQKYIDHFVAGTLGESWHKVNKQDFLNAIRPCLNVAK